MHQLVGLIPNQTVQQLINLIIDTLTQEEFDYWGEVKDEVMLVVGQYINEHNMNQVEVYQEDLITLLDRSAAKCSYNENPTALQLPLTFPLSIYCSLASSASTLLAHGIPHVNFDLHSCM